MNDPTYARHVIGGSIGIYLVFMMIRRSYRLDEMLSTQAQLVRWAIVLITFFTNCSLEPRLPVLRVVIGILGLSFFCWPNTANRLLAVPRPPSRT